MEYIEIECCIFFLRPQPHAIGVWFDGRQRLRGLDRSAGTCRSDQRRTAGGFDRERLWRLYLEISRPVKTRRDGIGVDTIEKGCGDFICCTEAEISVDSRLYILICYLRYNVY
jgi:hypothetical protein